MKKSLTILFCFVILLPTIFKVNILFNYIIHKEYIALEVCEKKEVEDNTCQGKCHLSKSLTQIDTTEKQPHRQNLQHNIESIYFLENGHTNKSITLNASYIETCILRYNMKLSPPHLPSIFHPPSTFSI